MGTSILSQHVDSASELAQKIATNLFAHIGNAPQEDVITILTVQRRSPDV